MAALLENLDHPEILEQLIAAGADATVKDSSGANGLHLIAAKRRPILESAQVLFAAGTPIDELDDRHQTPLFRAIYEGESSETVSWLLNHGATIDVPGVRYTPLQAASYWSQVGIMELLLQAGANPNVSTEDAPQPPLVQAMGSEQHLIASVTTLLKYGADPAFRGYGTQTPLARAAYCACDSQTPKTEKIAVLSMLFEAAEQRATPFSQELVEDAFSECSMNYVPEVFRLFFQKGASVNLQQGDVARNDYTRPLILACATKSISVSDLDDLISRGADPTLTDGHGRSPLHAAAGNSVLAAVEPLMSSGAVIDQADDEGKTALHVACDVYKYSVPTQEDMMFRAGIFNHRPIDLATMNERDKRAYYLRVGFDIRRSEEQKQNLQFIKLLLNYGASLTVQDNRGATPLHYASVARDDELALLILGSDSGRHVLVDKVWKTPLHWAAEHGAVQVAKALISQSNISLHLGDTRDTELDKMIAKAHSDFGGLCQPAKNSTDCSPNLCSGPCSGHILIHMRDSRGQQALHVAAAAGQEHVVAALLEMSDISLMTIDHQGKTPLRLAEEGKHFACSTKIRAAVRKQKEKEHRLRMEKIWRYGMVASAALVLVTVGFLASSGGWLTLDGSAVGSD